MEPNERTLWWVALVAVATWVFVRPDGEPSKEHRQLDQAKAERLEGCLASERQLQLQLTKALQVVPR